MAKSGLTMDVGPLVKAMLSLREQSDELLLEAGDQAAEIITGEAKQEDVCPYLTGATSDSHTWVRGPNKGEWTIGVNTVYAAAIHERHPTKSRWLVRTVVERGPRVIDLSIQAAMRRRNMT